MFNLKLNGKNNVISEREPSIKELSDEAIEKASGGAGAVAIREFDTLSYLPGSNVYAWCWGGGSIMANLGNVAF